MKTASTSCRCRGFTIVEIAVVIMLVALMAGGLMMPLGAQMDLQKEKNTQTTLAEIKEALTGYAIVNGGLPCPDTTLDPAAVSFGQSPVSCSGAATADGYLPFKSLGLTQVDAWGTPCTAAPCSRSGDWRYRVDSSFVGSTFAVDTATASNLRVQKIGTTALTAATEPPVAIIYSTGADLLPNAANATYDNIYTSDNRTAAFDDILVWISRPALINRMVAAGKLPR